MRMELRGDAQRLSEVVGVEAAVKIWQAFAGQTLYMPKLQPPRPDPRDYIRNNPDASPITVVSVCLCSRSTYYRVRKELERNGNEP